MFRSDRRNQGLLFAALLIATALAYYPAWHGGLLWDDHAHLTQPALQSLQGLLRIWTDLGATQQYYPLAHSAFWVQHHLWGDSLLGYHLVNILLHAVSAFLIAAIVRRFAERDTAILAALIFALHPVHVESVAWISELKNTLSTCWYLLAFLAYLRFDRARDRRFYALALALFACALLTKTVTATFPAALLVVFWYTRGRLQWRRDVLPLAPFFTLGIGAGLLTAWVERNLIGAQGAEFDLTLIERFLLAGRVVWFYVFKLLLPIQLSFVYPRWHIDQAAGWQFIFPIALVGLAVLLWRQRARSRAPLAALLLFCGSLFPALGFFDVFPFRYSFVADHFQYLASIPLIVLFAAAVTWALRRLDVRTGAAPIVALLLITGPLAALTWRQSRDYASAEELYRATIARNPQAWMAYNNLARLLMDDGRTMEARTYFTTALELNPDVAELQMNVGRLLVEEGRLPEAIVHLEHAIRLEPAFADAHSNLGVALLRQNRAAASLFHFEEARRIAPGHMAATKNLAAAHLSLGVALAQSGNIAEAVGHFRSATAVEPNDAVLRYNLGTSLLALGQFSDAATELEAALQIRPDFPEARANLAQARAGQ